MHIELRKRVDPRRDALGINSIYKEPTTATAISIVHAERHILNPRTDVAPEVPIDDVAAALALAMLGVAVMLKTLLTMLASASTTLVLKLSRSDCTPDGSVVAHAGVKGSVTGGAVAYEY